MSELSIAFWTSVPNLSKSAVTDPPSVSKFQGAMSMSSGMCSVWPKEASPASKSTSEVMLIALYDVGVHVAILAHGPLPALLAVADGHLLRVAAHGG